MKGIEGSTLGRYELRRRIAQGGMAEVYLGYDRRVRRQVAIKVLYGRDESFVRRFEREALAVGTLSHDHILPLYDFGEQRPWYYLVMPYVQGGTLREYLQKRKRLTLEEAASFLDQIASALQYAHDHGVIHRDVKPSNILLRRDGFAYLVDFGLARAMLGADSLTGAGALVGTPEYMAPEQSNGIHDYRSDIYSLGVILYHMLTGRVPFMAESPVAISLKHIQDEPTSPRELNSEIPQSIEDVILKALAKDPNERYQEAQTLSIAYRQALQQEQMPTQTDETVPTRPAQAEPLEPHRRGRFTAPTADLSAPNHRDQFTVPTTDLSAPNHRDQFTAPTTDLSAPSDDLSAPHCRGRFTLLPSPTADLSAPSAITKILPETERELLQCPPAPPLFPLVGTPQPSPISSPPSTGSTRRKRRLRPIFLALTCLLALALAVPLGLLSRAQPPGTSGFQQRTQTLSTQQTATDLTATASAQVQTTLTAQAQTQATLAAQAREQATAGITSSLGAGNVLYSDTLTNPKGDTLDSTSGGWIDDGSQCSFKSGSYHVQTYIAHAAAWCYSNQQQFSNAIITVQAQLLRGDTYGLIFRLNPTERAFYALEIDSKGDYRFIRASGRDPSQWLTLIDWTHSNAILSGYGHTNTFLVIATDSHFRFYINKQLIVTNFSDTTYTAGLIGLLVAGDNAHGTEAAFNNIWVFQK